MHQHKNFPPETEYFLFLEKRRVFLGGKENSPAIIVTEEKQKENQTIFKEEPSDITTEAHLNTLRELQRTPDDTYILIETIGETIDKHHISKDAALQITKELFPGFTGFHQDLSTLNADGTINKRNVTQSSFEIQTDSENFAIDAGKNINNPIEPIAQADREDFNNAKHLISQKLGDGTLFVGFRNNIATLGFKAGATLDDGIQTVDFKVEGNTLVAITELTEQDIKNIKEYNKGDKGEDISKINLDNKDPHALSFVNTMTEDSNGQIIADSETVARLAKNDNTDIYYDGNGNKVTKQADGKYKKTGKTYTIDKNKNISGAAKDTGEIQDKELCVGGQCAVNTSKTYSKDSVQKWAPHKEMPLTALEYTAEAEDYFDESTLFPSVQEAQKNSPNVLAIKVQNDCIHCKNLMQKAIMTPYMKEFIERNNLKIVFTTDEDENCPHLIKGYVSPRMAIYTKNYKTGITEPGLNGYSPDNNYEEYFQNILDQSA